MLLLTFYLVLVLQCLDLTAELLTIHHLSAPPRLIIVQEELYWLWTCSRVPVQGNFKWKLKQNTFGTRIWDFKP